VSHRLLGIAAEAPPPDLVLPPKGRVKLHLRLPLRPALRFPALGSDEIEGLEIEISSDTQTLPVWLAPARGGGHRAELAEQAGRVVRLTITNRGESPVSLARSSILGESEARAPLLPVRAPARSNDAPLNVVLYVIDTLRADRLSLHGYERPTSPRLDALAADAFVFDLAYAPSSHTLPSVTSLFTARYPSSVAGRLGDEPPSNTTLAEVFRAAGYRTAAFNANLVLPRALGYDRGFERYVVPLRPDGETPRFVGAATLHEHAERWIRQQVGQPFFLYVQTMDVHSPYRVPDGYRERFVSGPASIEEALAALPEAERTPERVDSMQAFADAWNPERYDAAVAYADAALGEFLDLFDTLGLRDDTIFVITSDHGEPLLEHGEFRHGVSLYEEVVRIPLIMLLPERMALRGRSGAPVSLQGLGPTLVDLAGLEQPALFGAPSWRSPSPGRAQPIVGELPRMVDHLVVAWFVREGPWKLIKPRTGKSTLYHLARDPEETSDVAALHPVTVAYLERQLVRLSPALGAAPAQPAHLMRGLGDDAREALERNLEALGYIDR
jgi:arylsulfatase A-like enzyme